MGINLVPEVEDFRVKKFYFQRISSSETTPPGIARHRNGSVEEGCISEGEHKVLTFAAHGVQIRVTNH